MEPIATTSAAVDRYIDEMRDELKKTDFGKVGIVFTVCDNQVTYVREIKERGYKLNKTLDSDIPE